MAMKKSSENSIDVQSHSKGNDLSQKAAPEPMIPTKNPVQDAGSAVLNSWSRLSRATRSWCSPGLFAMVWNGLGEVSDEAWAQEP